MGLTIWNQTSDPYDHDQLADNWMKVDYHDHTPGRGIQIPTEGIADRSITPIKLAASLPDPTGAYVSYKNVADLSSATAASPTAGLKAVGRTSSVATQALPVSSNSIAVYVDPADYTVADRTTVFRLRALILNNLVAPGVNFTLGLYPVTGWTSTASNTMDVSTVGSAVVGSGFTINAPPASTSTGAVSTDFSLGAGYYIVGATLSGAAAAGSRPGFNVQLQVRQV